jgi:hypothetical protein
MKRRLPQGKVVIREGQWCQWIATTKGLLFMTGSRQTGDAVRTRLAGMAPGGGAGR